MTTPTPNTEIEFEDVNYELNFSNTATQQISNGIVRQLTGAANKQDGQAEILLSGDLGGKVGYSEILAPFGTSNNQASVGDINNIFEASLLLRANTDLYTPDIAWSASIETGSLNVVTDDISFIRNNKDVTVVLTASNQTKIANLVVTGVVSYGGHVVGTKTKNILLGTAAVDPGLQVTADPSFTVSVDGIAAQTAITTVKARTSNTFLAPNTTFRFTATKVTGETASIVTDASTIVFSLKNDVVNTTKTSQYNLLTEMIYTNSAYPNGRVVARKTNTVNLSAQYVSREIRYPPQYNLYPSAALLSEGDSVTFFLETKNVLNGTIIPYQFSGSGIYSNDFTTSQLSGSLVVQGAVASGETFNGGTARVSLTTVKDNLNEGDETLVLSLTNTRNKDTNYDVNTSVVIKDTSRVPTYQLVAPAEVDEGDSFTVQLKTEDVAVGTVLGYTITGVSSADINGAALTGTFTVGGSYDNGTATKQFTTTADLLTEGAERFVIALDNGKASTSVLINDTSLTPPTYRLDGPLEVREGENLTISLFTTNLGAGNVVPYTISGSGITSDDISGASLTGSFTVDSAGFNSKTFTIKNDVRTEGTESLKLALNNGKANVVVNILDTSKAPVYRLVSADTVDEGASITVTLETENVGDGVILPWSIQGSGVNASDLLTPLAGQFTVNGGRSSVVLTTKQDLLTEGNETMTIYLTNIPSVKKDIIIRDTSTTETAGLRVIGGVTQNNNFANAASQYATLDLIAEHDCNNPQGFITFRFNHTGDTTTSQVYPESNSSGGTTANTQRRAQISLYHNFSTDGYGYKKSTTSVTAELRLANGYLVDTKTLNNLVLRTGAYGLSYSQPPSNTQIGYLAQTATSAASATWRAPSSVFSWVINKTGTGVSNTSIVNDTDKSATVDLRATTTGGGSLQTNTATFSIGARLRFDGVDVTTKTYNDIVIKAQSNAYSFSLAPNALTKFSFTATGSTTAAIRTLASHNIAGGTVVFTRSNPSVAFTSNTSAADVSVTSPAAGGANAATTVVSGSLYAGATLIETKQTPLLTVEAVTHNLQIIGANTVVSGYAIPQVATTGVKVTSSVGSVSLVYPPTKVSGDDLTTTQVNGTEQTLRATSTGGTKYGVYRYKANLTYKDQVVSETKDFSANARVIPSTINVTKTETNADKKSFLAAQTATAVISASTPDYPFANKIVPIVTAKLATGSLAGGVADVNINYITTPPTRTDVTISVAQGSPGVNLSNYSITFELRDLSNNQFIQSASSTGTVRSEIYNSGFNFGAGTVGNKYWTFNDRPLNGFGYPEVTVVSATWSQNVNYQATANTSIPNRSFTFSQTGATAGKSTLTFNASTGAALLRGVSTYIDNNGAFTVSNDTDTVNVTSEVLSGGVRVTDPVTRTNSFDIRIPGGRVYRIKTYQDYGVRMYHTRDPFGNDNERINYYILPSSTRYTAGSGDGGEVKWMGFHKQSVKMPNLSASPVSSYLYDPNWNTNKPKPLRGSSDGINYYSSQAHYNFAPDFNPASIIPNNYFMIMSFNQTGTPTIGDVFLAGSDGKLYGPLKLWKRGSQNDSSRSNDAFSWFIYEWAFPAGVTIDYAFISNRTGTGTGVTADTSNIDVFISGSTLTDTSITTTTNISIGTVGGGTGGTDTQFNDSNLN